MPAPLILPHHQKMLTDSGIDPEVVAERGYKSVTVKAELQHLGFAASQRGVPTLLIPIHGVNGGVVLYHHRPDQPRLGERNKIVKYEFPKGAKMAVDVHPRNRKPVRDPNVPLFITEGVRKADSATSRGLCCIGLIGTFNWRGTNEFDGKTALPDWESIALKDKQNNPRQVYICFDSDVMLKATVHTALSRLAAFLEQRGASVAFIYLPHGEGGAKTGLDDYLASGRSTDDLLALASIELRQMEGSDDSADSIDEGKDQTASQKILALAAGVEVFTSERGEGFARFSAGGCKQAWPIRSSPFKQWLLREYYMTHGKAVSSQALGDALGVIEANARYEGEQRCLGVRCARDEADGSIWIDAGDSMWSAYHVTKAGWELGAEPPALFRRRAVLGALPEAEANAKASDINRLRKFVNVRSDNGWRQFVAWLVSAWIPEIGHPVLVVHGEQGSAKSTLIRLAKRLIDPSPTELIAEPRDSTYWLQSADHTWLVALDNVSALPGWLSDAMCRAVTGEASVKRQLYTDNEDVLVSFRRPIALTGIEVVAQRADLLDRSILLALDPIPAETRRPETAMFAEFEKERPRLIGALLSLLSGVMAELAESAARPPNKLPLPRMADFAHIGMAVERVLGWPEGSFMTAYREGIGEQHDEALASYLIAEPLLKLVDREWSGSASELLEALGRSVEERQTKRTGWPSNGKALSGQLKRMAPNLRAGGITVEWQKTGSKRLIHLKRQQNNETELAAPTNLDTDDDELEENWSMHEDENDANDALFRVSSRGVIDEDIAIAAIKR